MVSFRGTARVPNRGPDTPHTHCSTQVGPALLVGPDALLNTGGLGPPC